MTIPRHGGNLVWAATLSGCPVSSILDFSASINPLGPPPSVLTAIQSALTSLVHYPDPSYQQLRSQLGEYHHLEGAWVLPGNGSAELLTLGGRLLAELDQTWLVTPAFGDYGRSLKAFGAKIQGIPWDVDQPFPLSALGSRSVPPATGLILNNPHNPTGYLLKRAEILPLLEHFRWVILDEAFMDFLPPAYQESLIADLPHYSNLIILRSLTKFYSVPGLRIGYALGHPHLLQELAAWRDPWPVNVLAEQAAITALQDHGFQQQTWDWLTTTQPQFYQALQALPGFTPYPSAVNFFLVKLAGSATALQRFLLQEHQILIRDCLSFPELGDRFFRIAVRTPIENQRLLTGLAEWINGLC
ncbi:MAG: threonine-phosphate decarboxylase CobD [Merismopediaceae bacterium]|nr:threonine-phosphate decarboxylase CobD [Merismopediaceae bacterium]